MTVEDVAQSARTSEEDAQKPSEAIKSPREPIYHISCKLDYYSLTSRSASREDSSSSPSFAAAAADGSTDGSEKRPAPLPSPSPPSPDKKPSRGLFLVFLRSPNPVLAVVFAAGTDTAAPSTGPACRTFAATSAAGSFLVSAGEEEAATAARAAREFPLFKTPLSDEVG